MRQESDIWMLKCKTSVRKNRAFVKLQFLPLASLMHEMNITRMLIVLDWQTVEYFAGFE